MNIAEFKQIFSEISVNAGQLLDCLSEEFEAINKNDYERLISLSEKKQQLVDALNLLDKRRTLEVDAGNFEKTLEKLDPGHQLSDQWNSSSDIIKKCRVQNEINGRLLNRRNIIARETMAIFTGVNTSNETTYGPNGLKHSQGSMLPDVQA